MTRLTDNIKKRCQITYFPRQKVNVVMSCSVLFVVLMCSLTWAAEKRLVMDDGQVTMEDLQRQISELKTRLDRLDHGPVAFKSHMTESIAPAANEHIVFDDVQLNLGGAYDVHTSVFLAPYNGTYMFSLSVCSTTAHYIVLDLMRNNDTLGRVLAGDYIWDDCSSETSIAILKAGDKVYVQHRDSIGDYIRVQNGTINSFTGVLLERL